MPESHWEPIAGFQSPSEFQRFERWIADQVSAGIATEVPVVAPYWGTTLRERWHRHVASEEVWRLVSPDFPFRGIFERV